MISVIVGTPVQCKFWTVVTEYLSTSQVKQHKLGWIIFLKYFVKYMRLYLFQPSLIIIYWPNSNSPPPKKTHWNYCYSNIQFRENIPHGLQGTHLHTLTTHRGLRWSMANYGNVLFVQLKHKYTQNLRIMHSESSVYQISNSILTSMWYGNGESIRLYSLFVGPWPLFQFLDLLHSR
jgi:hypothetical protein